MIKVVIDTNVFISAAIGLGYSRLIVNEIFNNVHLELCISNPAIEEFERVALYPHLIKRQAFRENAQIILNNVSIFGVTYRPSLQVSILKDSSDNKFLELACEAKADYLVTGNHKDFTISEFYDMKIVSPKTFWELYEQNNL